MPPFAISETLMTHCVKTKKEDKKRSECCLLFITNLAIQEQITSRKGGMGDAQGHWKGVTGFLQICFLWQIAISYHGDDNIHTTAFLKTGIPAPSKRSTAPTRP